MARHFNKLVELVEAQGGDSSYIHHPVKFEKAKHIIPLKAEKSWLYRIYDHH